MDEIASAGTPWSRIPTPGYPKEGTPFDLPTGDPEFRSGQFFITEQGIQHSGPHPFVVPARVAEPGTLFFLVAGLAGLAAVGRRRGRRD